MLVPDVSATLVHNGGSAQQASSQNDPKAEKINYLRLVGSNNKQQHWKAK